MNFREEPLGAVAMFLLPSLKLKEPGSDGSTAESQIHRFLMDNFGGYTAQAGNIFGFWKEQNGAESYGEHRAFTVALVDDGKLPELKRYLAHLATQMKEECLYLQVDGQAFLIYAES